jgi:hypothetical protein
MGNDWFFTMCQRFRSKQSIGGFFTICLAGWNLGLRTRRLHTSTHNPKHSEFILVRTSRE